MTVLVLAPHPDDEVLGAGGAIAKFAAVGESVHLAVVTGVGDGAHPFVTEEAGEIARKECMVSSEILGISKVSFANLPTTCLDQVPIWKTNTKIREIIEDCMPDQLYLPFPYDLHKDHNSVAYAGLVATRPYLDLGNSVKKVCFYETLTETHLAPPYLDAAFQPNMYIDISSTLEKKVRAMESYKSQLQTGVKPRTAHGIRTLAHFRGMHVGVNAAEAFIVARELL